MGIEVGRYVETISIYIYIYTEIRLGRHTHVIIGPLVIKANNACKFVPTFWRIGMCPRSRPMELAVNFPRTEREAAKLV